MSRIADILDHAASTLEGRGWRKSTTRSNQWRLTVADAINLAADPWTKLNRDTRHALLAHVGWDDLLAFNDSCRTRSEVVAKLREVALALRAPIRSRSRAPTKTPLVAAYQPLATLDDLPLHSEARLPEGSHWACQGVAPQYEDTVHFDWRCSDCVTRAERFVAAGPVPLQEWIGPSNRRRVVPLSYLISRARTLGV